MTEHQLMMEGVDVAKGAAKVASILGKSDTEETDMMRVMRREIGSPPAPSIAAPNATPQRTLNPCPVCQNDLHTQGRNRLSDCGHMRKSEGKFVPRRAPHAAKVDQPASGGGITMEQREQISARIASILALQYRQLKTASELQRVELAMELENKEHSAYFDSLVASPVVSRG